MLDVNANAKEVEVAVEIEVDPGIAASSIFFTDPGLAPDIAKVQVGRCCRWAIRMKAISGS